MKHLSLNASIQEVFHFARTFLVGDSSFRSRCIRNDNNVIPNRDLWSSVRNLHRPIRNGSDCTLAWREILQGKAFQNDMRLGKRFFLSAVVRMTLLSSRTHVRDLTINSFLGRFFAPPHSVQNDNGVCRRFFLPMVVRMTVVSFRAIARNLSPFCPLVIPNEYEESSAICLRFFGASRLRMTIMSFRTETCGRV